MSRKSLREAILATHPPDGCNDNTCELSAAMRADLVLYAAWLLVRPSEGLLADDDEHGVLEQFREICPGLGEDPRVVEESLQMADVPHRVCESCDASVYVEGKCGECGFAAPSDDASASFEELVMGAIAVDVVTLGFGR